MSNASFFMNGTYDLNNLVTTDVITNPENWLVAYNNALNHIPISAMLIVIGIILFITVKTTGTDVKDSEAGLYAGLIISIAGLLLALVSVEGSPLMLWSHLFVIWVVTGVFALLDSLNRRY